MIFYILEVLKQNEEVMEKEIRIDIPDGYEIDCEKSTFECIRFRKKNDAIPWRENSVFYGGWKLDERYNDGMWFEVDKKPGIDFSRKALFATKEHAKSAIAMAKIGQIMVNDERFGGIVTDDEWKNYSVVKYCIHRYNGEIAATISYYDYFFMGFHTKAQMDLFMDENMDLIKDYFMLS